MVDGLAVVIAAAGTGSRMGAEINKQFLLLDSRPILAYSLDVFERMDLVSQVVVAANAREVDYCAEEVIAKFAYRKVSRVVAGGASRQESVWQGLQHIEKDAALVAVHDGARPLLTTALIMDLYQAAQKWGAAVPGVPVRDTLKTVDDEAFVQETLNRSLVTAIQTPQVFRRADLYRAYQMAHEQQFQATDDAALYEKYIGRVRVVPGDHRNLKITTPEDIIIAESFLHHMKR